MSKPTSAYGILIGLLISVIFWAILYYLKSLYPETFQISSVRWTAIIYSLSVPCIVILCFFSSMSTYYLKSDESLLLTTVGVAGMCISAPMGLFLASCLKYDIVYRFEPFVIVYAIAVIGAGVFGAMVGRTDA